MCSRSASAAREPHPLSDLLDHPAIEGVLGAIFGRHVIEPSLLPGVAVPTPRTSAGTAASAKPTSGATPSASPARRHSRSASGTASPSSSGPRTARAATAGRPASRTAAAATPPACGIPAAVGVALGQPPLALLLLLQDFLLDLGDLLLLGLLEECPRFV